MHLRPATSRTVRRLLVALFPLLIPITEAGGYSAGPPDGKCGDPPGYSFCTSCHSSFPLNSGNGTLSVLGIPASYVPDSVYVIEVHLQDPGQRRWGFEMTVIRQADRLQAGTLAAVDPVTTQISEGPGTIRDYAKQTAAGTFPLADHGAWELAWTAPAPGTGEVHFYAAGNAANNNNQTTFDYVYGLDAIVPERIGAAAGEPAGAGVLPWSASPNPASGPMTIRFWIPREGQTLVALFDPAGRRVRELLRADLPAGSHRLVWDGTGTAGTRVPAGTYFVVLQSIEQRFSRTITVVR